MTFLSLWGLSYAVSEVLAADVLLRAGTQSDYPPFLYVDENNVLTGYDVEMLREIDKRLDGYAIDIKTLEWDSIFLALESRTLDLIGDQIGVTEERKLRFLFSEPYFATTSYIIVKKGRSDIKTMKDLEGKTVVTVVGDNDTKFLEDYNEKNGGRIKLEYLDGVPDVDILVAVRNGKYDAYVHDPIMVTTVANKHNIDIELVGEPVRVDLVALVFNKDDEGAKLKELIDPVIKELKTDGFLKELSIKWTGKDYVPK
jgi:L-cystine transport system substrate-binding protein